ncbi:TonB-dependent receptor [Sphingobium aquiterrae]|uniref:TonB-dependent receptor n=1 Tax=Sphingobium aquiterrae TaxID=2038656 RepID=UPI003015A484
MRNIIGRNIIGRTGLHLAASTGTIMIALAAAAPAYAQVADQAAGPQATAAEETPDIIVTGFRGSLENAIRIKKDAAGVVDAISAQDIADFPDANLADSLQRIPGISIERDGGEGRGITVRGLGGDFSRTRFNGLEAISATTGSTLGAGVNRGRTFDYSVFASELFNSIVVNKTQSASVDEGSLGATVDLQTGRPFDHPGFQAAFSAQAAYYDNNKSWAPRLAGLISDTWADDTIGVLLSVAYSKRKLQEDAYSNTNLADYTDLNNGFCPIVPGSIVTPNNPLIGSAPFTSQCVADTDGPFPGSSPDAYNQINRPGVFIARLPGYGRFLNAQERLGITGSIQFRPSDTALITIDGAYSRFKQVREDQATNPISLNRGNGSPPAGSAFTPVQLAGRPNMKIRDVEVNDAGEIVYGVFDDTDFGVTSALDRSTTEFYQVNLNYEQELGDRGKAKILIGQSRSFFDNPYSRLVTFSRFDGDGFVFDARETPKTPYLNYGFDATNPNNWSFVNGYDNIRLFRSSVDNRFKTGKLDLSYDIDDNFTVKTGAAWKEFKFISKREQRIASQNLLPALPSGVTMADISKLLTVDGINLPDGATNSLAIPNIPAIMDLFDVDCECQNQYGDFRMGSIGTGALGDNRSVRERDVSAYLQADYKFDLANGMRIRGDAGLRYARTNQSSTGYVGASTLTNASRSYENFLPSVNFALDITQEITLRLGAAKVMSRPSLSFLTPGGSIGTDAAPFSATIGNPDLDPYKATNFDASLEWYFQPGALVSVAFFHKKVSNFVQQITQTTTYAAAGLPLSLLRPGQDPNTTTNVTTYENTSGGKINGIELSYQQPFTFLPGFLKNFGAIVNYTHIDSKISYFLTRNATGGSLSAPLINVSPNSANATLYYEDSKLSARVSMAYRDEYIRIVPVRAGLADTAGAYSSTNIDASISYKLTDRISIGIDAINLTNQPTSYWDGQDRRDQQVYSQTGRQFFFGARFKY